MYNPDNHSDSENERVRLVNEEARKRNVEASALFFKKMMEDDFRRAIQEDFDRMDDY